MSDLNQTEQLPDSPSVDRKLIERTGERFDPEKILRARERTWAALETIAARIRPGMAEEEGQALANAVLIELGGGRKWHRTWVRFGPNTLLPYGEPSQPGVVLGTEDLFFIDIGPVWDGYEGDCGKTFVVGSDPEMHRCVDDGRAIFDLVRHRWEVGALHGRALYDFAIAEARERGWILNLHEANGHRISDFPHAIYHRGPISDLDFTPAPARWVLEIQIRHRSRPFGSFYEDLLV